MKRLLFALTVFAAAACAADLAGTWKGTAEGPQGSLQRTFTFHVDGTKLTGETSSEMLGKSVINDGKIGSLTQRLYDAIVSIQYGQTPDADGWTVEV